MKLGRILNKKLNTAIADMGHGEMIIVCDAGMKIPTEAQRIDLAVERDLPTVDHILELLVEDFCYERVIVCEDLRKFNPVMYEKVEKTCTRCQIEEIPYDTFMATLPQTAKYIVRTGSFEPYADIALISAVDAPRWFNRPGVVVPPVYEGRA